MTVPNIKKTYKNVKVLEVWQGEHYSKCKLDKKDEEIFFGALNIENPHRLYCHCLRKYMKISFDKPITLYLYEEDILSDHKLSLILYVD